MSDRSQYVTCLSALPQVRDLEKVDSLPISLLRLEERLRMLPAADVEMLHRIRSLASWHESTRADYQEEEYVRLVTKLMAEIKDARLHAVLAEKFELRTLIVALRLRRNGVQAEDLPKKWGYGQHVNKIRQNWQLPDFGLGRVYAWLQKAAPMIEAHNAREFENLLLLSLWQGIKRMDRGFEYDFSALVKYILQWDIIERWTLYDAKQASLRFDKMIEAAIPDDIVKTAMQ